MVDIALLTGRTMPREVPENGLLVLSSAHDSL
jgi:hypothetical protein